MARSTLEQSSESHITAEEYVAFCKGRLTDEEKGRLFRHARGCFRCDRLLEHSPQIRFANYILEDVFGPARDLAQTGPHPFDRLTLEDFGFGKLDASDPRIPLIEAHTGQCSLCRAEVAGARECREQEEEFWRQEAAEAERRARRGPSPLGFLHRLIRR